MSFNELIAEKGKVRAFAEMMVKLPKEVNPPILGSRTRIWKQDPSIRDDDLLCHPRTVYVHGDVKDGPSDTQIETVIDGKPGISPDLNRDFLIDPEGDPEAFDAVHTYTVVRQVLTMYQRVLGKKLDWQWNNDSDREVIKVYPRAGRAQNAYYSRGEKKLKFFYFTSGGRQEGKRDLFTCRSLDIVAHETGHAVLDALKPNWISFDAPAQTGGLHEAFGDLTSIFLILSQMDLVEYIIAKTKADLHHRNILSSLAEEFGNALGFPEGLRNADNNKKLSEVSKEVHHISEVFTGGVFDIMADIFTANRKPRYRDDAEVLYETGKYMAWLTTCAIDKSPDKNATFANVAETMIELVKADGRDDYATFIEKHFTFREVLGARTFAGLLDSSELGIYPDRSYCCGTMKRSEYFPQSISVE